MDIVTHAPVATLNARTNLHTISEQHDMSFTCSVSSTKQTIDDSIEKALNVQSVYRTLKNKKIEGSVTSVVYCR